MFCSQDNEFPYNCNERDSNLTKNYSASYSPYVGAFNKYKISNTSYSYNIDYEASDRADAQEREAFLKQIAQSKLDKQRQLEAEDQKYLDQYYANNDKYGEDNWCYDLNGNVYQGDKCYGEADKPIPQSGQTLSSAGALVLTAGITTQLDSPLPGPADLVGGVILIGAAGVAIYGVGQWAFEATTGPKPASKFKDPTNPPSNPDIPDTWTSEPTPNGRGDIYTNPANPNETIRVMKPTPQYPNGYWVKTSPKTGKPINPTTGVQGRGPEDMHIPLP